MDWVDLPWKRGTRLVPYQDGYQDILLNDEFECVFLDKTADYQKEIEIMQFIKDHHLDVSIFMAHDKNLIEALGFQYRIEGILYTPLLENNLFHQFFLDENRTLEQRVVSLFNKLGISSSQNGYYYLKSAIKWNVRLSTTNTKLKIMQLYPILAQQYNTSVPNIERNMRYVIEKAFLQGNSKMLDELFHNIIHLNSGKVTNTEFIQSCTDYLNSQLH